jgi:hypothetical protein
MAQAIHPTSTNRTEPTEIQAAAPGSSVSWYVTHLTTIVDGMVMTQEANILTTTRRLTPWPDATPEPMIDEAAAWVVEMGMPMPVAPKIAVTAPMLAANPELARNVVIRRPIVSMIFQPPHTVPAAMASSRSPHMYRSSVLERGRAGMGLAACSRTKASDTEPTRCALDTDRSKPEPRPPQLTAGLTDDRHGDGHEHSHERGSLEPRDDQLDGLLGLINRRTELAVDVR